MNMTQKVENSGNQTKKYLFHVEGMHCKSCVLLTESKVGSQSGVREVRANLHKQTIEIMGDFGEKTDLEIANYLSQSIEPNGYKIVLEKTEGQKKNNEFIIAVPIAVAFIGLFIALQKMGIVNLVDASSVSFGTAFVIGIVASLSTCMAVVGGLVLSMSAVFAKEGSKARPHIYFHLSRLVTFFLLGGVIGLVGKSFALNTVSTFVLGLAVGLVILVMGLNLLDLKFAKRFSVSMPKRLGKITHGMTTINHSAVLMIAGLATFFLPCGFTQSMQIYTLSVGGFIPGALTMFAFALGTLPVLALISFGSFEVRKLSWRGIFFKTAGIIVIAFALFNIINSAVVIGIIPPIFNF